MFFSCARGAPAVSEGDAHARCSEAATSSHLGCVIDVGPALDQRTQRVRLLVAAAPRFRSRPHPRAALALPGRHNEHGKARCIHGFDAALGSVRLPAAPSSLRRRARLMDASTVLRNTAAVSPLAAARKAASTVLCTLCSRV